MTVRLRDSVRPALMVFAAVWVGWALIGLFTVGVVTKGGDPLGVPGLAARPLSPGWHNLWDVGFRSDAYWYVRIATGGYSKTDASAAFFPGYPALIHVVDWLPGIGPRAAAAIVAQGAFLGSLVVMHALTRREFSDETAAFATRYLAIFPTGFFFLSDLSESTFLLFALLTFWYVRADLWVLSLAPAAFAGATRSAGVALVPALLVEALLQGRAAGRIVSLRLVAALAPAAGLGAYLGGWGVAGHWRAPLDAQKNWGRVKEFPLVTLSHAWKYAHQYQSYWLMDLVVVGFVIAATVVAIVMIRPSYVVFSLASLLLPLTDPYPDRPLMSMPRFVVVLWPTAWVLAELVRRKKLADPLVVGGFAIGFALLGTLSANCYAIF